MKKATVSDLKRPTGPFLYKYRSVGNLDFLREMIVDHTIYFSKPSEFNDPEEDRPRLFAPSPEPLAEWLYVKSANPNPFLTHYGYANKSREEAARLVQQVGFEAAMMKLEKGVHGKF